MSMYREEGPLEGMFCMRTVRIPKRVAYFNIQLCYIIIPLFFLQRGYLIVEMLNSKR